MRRSPVLALVLLCAACADQELPGETQFAALQAVDRPAAAQANSDIAALRAATAHLQRFSQPRPATPRSSPRAASATPPAPWASTT
jgi:hypothetical protein